MTDEHGLPIIRACRAARLSRAAYYKPGVDQAVRDAEMITALQAIVVGEQRWGFWKCRDRRGSRHRCSPSALGYVRIEMFAQA